MKLVLFFSALVASLVLSATASAHSGAPWRTEAWASAKLHRVHYWHGYALDPEYSDCSIGGIIGYVDHYDRNGEQLYRHFRCNLMTYDGNHDFNVTLHTLRYYPYYTVKPGWMSFPG